MPYLDPANHALPYASGCDTSRAGAKAAKAHAATQIETMRAIYRDNPRLGVTDRVMHELTGYDINVVCARRNELGCVCVARRMGPRNVTVKAWALPEGR